MSKKFQVSVIAMTFLVFSCSAFAYVGPGLAGGAAMTVLGLAVALLMLAIGVIWYPLKRLFKYLFTKPSQQTEK